MIPSHTFIYKTWIVSRVTSLLESRFLKFLNFMFNYKQNRQFFYCDGNLPYTFLKIPEILIWVTLQNSSGWLLVKITQQAKNMVQVDEKKTLQLASVSVVRVSLWLALNTSLQSVMTVNESVTESKWSL